MHFQSLIRDAVEPAARTGLTAVRASPTARTTGTALSAAHPRLASTGGALSARAPWPPLGVEWQATPWHSHTMQKRRLGRSDPYLIPLGLGAWAIGGPVEGP